MKSKKVLQLFFIIIIVITVGLFFLNNFLNKRKLNEVVPDSIRSSLNFPTYYPIFSKDIEPEISSMNFFDGILIYSATLNNTNFTITQQAKPENFSLEKYLNNVGMDNVSQVQTSIGKGLKGRVMGNDSIIVENDKTIITISTAGDANLIEFVNSLSVYDP